MTTTAQIEDGLTDALTTISRCWPAMLNTPPGQRCGSASTDEVLSIDRRVSLRAETTALLASWARIIVEDRNLTHHLPLGTDTPGLCVLITRHARWFSGHEAAPDALSEIGRAAAQIEAVTYPARRDWLPLGPCPLQHPTTRTPCTGTIRGYGDPKRMPHCTVCGTEAVAEWWEREMFGDTATSRLVTAEELVTVVHHEFGKPVKAATIRQWVARGWITCALDDKRQPMRDPNGRALYDRGSVVYDLTRRGVSA